VTADRIGPPAARKRNFTPREREVLHRLALGEANKQIAQALACSVKTVEFHMRNLLRKVGVSSRLELIVAHMVEPPTADFGRSAAESPFAGH
jgi:DNA-binding NarL/FixJ family response regulator